MKCSHLHAGLMFLKYVTALKDAITADHGFSMDAPTVRNLVDIMSSYNHTERRDFLQL